MRVLTANETAEITNIRATTLQRPWWRRRHGLPAVRVGRRIGFLDVDVETWLKSRREPLKPKRPLVIDVRSEDVHEGAVK